uniref:OSJNBa0070M12.10 protein n=1 Tax=Oryza sativa subsp. japonica TaxID=39947 RepID=Q7XSP3_ORYSJ|nr:OSJNBa0070M12.10 [Oryza sativa Japonica Group]
MAASDSDSDADAAAAAAASLLPAPIHLLPPDALHNVLLRLPLRDAVVCRPSFSPVASSPSLLYLWLESPSPSPPSLPSSSSSSSTASTAHPPKSLAVCNPFAGTYSFLPLSDLPGRATAPSSLARRRRPRAHRARRPLLHPIRIRQVDEASPLAPLQAAEPYTRSGAAAVFALCDVGTPWRSQWKLFSCPLSMLTGGWAPVERSAWGDVFEILKRPRLLAGAGGRRVLMIGGLRSSFAIDAPCSTVLILRLDLATMEWDEAGRMPPNMYRCFTGLCEAAAQGNAMPTAVAGGNNKVKVFGGDGKVWFAGKRVRGKLAMWEEDELGNSGGKWDWVDGVPGYSDGVYRGFVFDGGFTAMP